ncbi:MAG: glycosyltransferase family 1 protein [Acidobacteriota bacterium]
MKVGLTTFGCDGGRSGIGRYLTMLLSEFRRSGRSDLFEILSHRDDFDGFGDHGIPTFEVSDRSRKPIPSLLWHQLALPGWCRRRGWDVVFLPAANRRLPAKVSCPSVGTVHDLSGLHVKGKYDKLRSAWSLTLVPRLARGLTKILTVSESSKRDIVEQSRVPEDRVVVTHLGVDHDTFQPIGRADALSEEDARELGVRSPYVLYVSRLEHPGKGHARLIEAFCKVRERLGLPHQLVLTGGDWFRAEEIHAAAARHAKNDEVLFAGFVPNAVLPALHRSAAAFVFPSLYEGFGLPLLEAMASGVPVACANRSSLPEVAGDAALLFDPESASELEAALETILTDEARRTELIAAGTERCKTFTWERTAQATLDVLEQAAGQTA